MVKTKDVLLFGGLGLLGIAVLSSLNRPTADSGIVGAAAPGGFNIIPAPPQDLTGLLAAIGGLVQPVQTVQPAPIPPFNIAQFLAPFLSQLGGPMVQTSSSEWPSSARRPDNRSGREFNVERLAPHELAQVEAAINSGASVTAELVRAWETQTGQIDPGRSTENSNSTVTEDRTSNDQGNGTGVSGGFLVPLQDQAQSLISRFRSELPLSLSKKTSGDTLDQLATDLLGYVPPDLEWFGLDDPVLGDFWSLEQLRQGLDFTFNVPDGLIPDFPSLPDPVGDTRDAIGESLSELGSTVDQGLTGVKIAAEAVGAGSLAANKIPKVGPRIIRPLQATVPGITGLQLFTKILVPLDLVVTAYEAATGRDIPVVGYAELLRQFGILPSREGDPPPTRGINQTTA